MKKLSKETILKKHRELWYKIAEIMERDGFNWRDCFSIDIIKEKAFKELGEKYIPVCGCWCCEYDQYFYDNCNNCPVEWGKDYGCSGSEYGSFQYACSKKKKDEAIMWAKKIAELPEREDMNDE